MNKSKAETMELAKLTTPEGALEDAHRASGNAPSGTRPDPEVVATARRRQFTSGDKRRIWMPLIAVLSRVKLEPCCAKKGFTPPT